ncbi:hypothetical protein [Streptomyces sp. NPDC091209]|uniref:hypothetical protein n=1 Tax=Streptomyces sp. NPDC091209 TaxID=3365974 RepID=UPI0038181463
MPQPESSSSSAVAVTVEGSRQLPFLLTPQQGEAARRLLSYVVSLSLPGPDAQLLAVVVAVRAARSGVGNVTGADLSALRLGDSREAVDALRGLGWQVGDALFDVDPAAPPVPITVPDLACGTDHPLPFGKIMRSRVSGWTTRALSVKPVKKLPPAARLAGLFLAAHGTSTLLGQIPSDLPEACRAAVPSLLDKGFLAELSADRFRLDPQVRHLSGLRPHTGEEEVAAPSIARAEAVPPRTPRFEFSADAWAEWKNSATPALRRHAEAVERCALCALPPERVAEAFMTPYPPPSVSEGAKAAYDRWQEAHPECGPLVARFTVAYRAEHGHGPSFGQLCAGLGWGKRRQMRGLIVQHLLSTGWLTNTDPVPWTLRPGPAAQDQDITLPGARSTATAVTARS